VHDRELAHGCLRRDNTQFISRVSPAAVDGVQESSGEHGGALPPQPPDDAWIASRPTPKAS
jgi:hypothetical protein